MNDSRQRILSIGGRGLVGSRIEELLSPAYKIHSVGNTDGVDITDPQTLGSVIGDSEVDVVLLLAAKADVDGCEEDKELGEKGDAWKVNVEGTKNVANACKKYGKKLVYISTDFVFDGNKEAGESYREDDTPHPINWYGQTKYEGEKVVQNTGIEYCIIRPAYPYRASYDQKKDFVRAIMGRLGQKQSVTAITDHYFTPTFIDDLAFALEALFQHNAIGIYHVVGSQTLTPYEATMQIVQTFSYDAQLVSSTTREVFFKGRAPRPFNLSLNNDKIHKLGVKMRTFTQGIEELKKQL